MNQPVEKKRRSWRWVVVMLVIAIAGALPAWRWLRGRAQAATPRTAPRWMAVQERSLSAKVNATGVVRLKTGAEIRVGAQLSGIVKRLYVTVGSDVKAGDVIAEIDARPIQAKVGQAEAQLVQARATQAKAATDADRTQQLFNAGIVSRQQWQDAQATLRAASASVQVAESAVADASVDLAYVEIRAPIGGTVASVSTQQGETVAASFATPTFVTIIRRDALELVAMVDEADIGNVRAGEPATFTTETWPDKEFTGTVLRVAPVATIISGVVNYEVTISIGNRAAMLRPDMTANVNIVTAERHALVIPLACLHRDPTGSWVYIRAASGDAERRAVTVGGRSAEGVEIAQGLSAGAAVLLLPQEEGKP